jgi:hypothetical protein
MSVIVANMGRNRAGDRHKSKQVNLRLPESLRKQLELLCDRQVTTLTAEIITAIREHLERKEMWPPPAKPRH